MCCLFLETASPPLRATSFRVWGSMAAVPRAPARRSTGRGGVSPTAVGVVSLTGGVAVDGATLASDGFPVVVWGSLILCEDVGSEWGVGISCSRSPDVDI